jgi:hypothetical protein
MPDSRRHRGAHPDDARLFAPDAVARLRVAAEEVVWLLNRGYAMHPAVTAVGNHHQLEARQRIALSRALCSDAARDQRRRRALPPDAISGRRLCVDAFNLIITHEVALSGGVVLVGADDAHRDLAGLRGTYRPVAETAPAVAAIAATARALRPREVAFLLDAAVSNSGRLRALLLAEAEAFGCPTTAELVRDPDPLLRATEDVAVSSDAAVLDGAARWANLGAWAIAERAPGAHLVAVAP